MILFLSFFLSFFLLPPPSLSLLSLVFVGFKSQFFRHPFFLLSSPAFLSFSLSLLSLSLSLLLSPLHCFFIFLFRFFPSKRILWSNPRWLFLYLSFVSFYLSFSFFFLFLFFSFSFSFSHLMNNNCDMCCLMSTFGKWQSQDQNILFSLFLSLPLFHFILFFTPDSEREEEVTERSSKKKVKESGKRRWKRVRREDEESGKRRWREWEEKMKESGKKNEVSGYLKGHSFLLGHTWTRFSRHRMYLGTFDVVVVVKGTVARNHPFSLSLSLFPAFDEKESSSDWNVTWKKNKIFPFIGERNEEVINNRWLLSETASFDFSPSSLISYYISF